MNGDQVRDVRHVGLLVPGVNQTVEPDFYRVMPPSAIVHTERMWFGSGGQRVRGESALQEMNKDLGRAIEHIKAACVDVVVYGCTSGSFTLGREFDQAVLSRIEEATGVPSV